MILALRSVKSESSISTASSRAASECNTATFRPFGPVGALRSLCSVCSLGSVWLVRAGMAMARVPQRVWRAVPRAAGRVSLLPVAGDGPGFSSGLARTR